MKTLEKARNALELFYFRMASNGWISPDGYIKGVPANHELRLFPLPIKLEIVSHCWQYAHFLVYQLSSLVQNPPTQAAVTMTVFYSREDAKTTRILAYFGSRSVANVTWNFVPLEKESLFRRSIGRNIAARKSQADWVWFTDCDVLFYPGCLDALAEVLSRSQYKLVFPRQLLYSRLMPEEDPIIQAGRQATEAVALPEPTDFSQFESRKAMGPIQIVHGDVARQFGYCDGIPVLQRPTERWAKAYEDRVFRWLLRDNGTPIDIANVVVLRHVVKGRYKKDSIFSRIRTLNRVLKG